MTRTTVAALAATSKSDDKPPIVMLTADSKDAVSRDISRRHSAASALKMYKVMRRDLTSCQSECDAMWSDKTLTRVSVYFQLVPSGSLF